MYLKYYNIKKDEKIISSFECNNMYKFEHCPNKIIK